MKLKKPMFYGLVAVLLVVFAFADLTISKAIYNPSSGFGIFFEIFGEIPMMLIGIISALALIITYDKRNTFVDYTNNIGFGIVAVLNALMGGFLMKSYLKLPSIMVVVLALVLMGAAYLFIKLVDRRYYKQLRQAAKVGVLLSILPILVINLIKIFWGRERFRHMLPPYSGFTPWYLPQAITTNNEFMSFPSGHSANSSVIFWITLIPLFIPSMKKYETPMTIFAIIWIIMVMISRIVVGAHFASDVLVGMALSISIFWLLKRKFVKEK